MYGWTSILKAKEERGARYFVYGTIRAGEMMYTYADTAEQAESRREDYQAKWHYRQVTIVPPVEDMDIAAELDRLGRLRRELQQQEREVVAQLRATVKRGEEREMAEADMARRAQVDRMTVRSWLGKRPSAAAAD